MDEHELERLFERFRARGELSALGEVFDRTASGLLTLAVHLVRDPVEAEDLPLRGPPARPLPDRARAAREGLLGAGRELPLHGAVRGRARRWRHGARGGRLARRRPRAPRARRESTRAGARIAGGRRPRPLGPPVCSCSPRTAPSSSACPSRSARGKRSRCRSSAGRRRERLHWPSWRGQPCRDPSSSVSRS